MHCQPQLKHRTTAIRKSLVPQNFLIGYAQISQVTLTVAGESTLDPPANYILE